MAGACALAYAPAADQPAAASFPASACRVRIGPFEISLTSDLPEAIQDFAYLYRGYRCTGAVSPDAIRMDVCAERRSLWGRVKYTVLGDGEAMFTGLAPAEVLPYIEWGINHRVIESRRGFLQFHAGMLARDGAGVVLAGPSGSGKSTLTAALAARGWQYLSDEFALIGEDDLQLHPFPKALCVKVGSFEGVRRMGLPLYTRRPFVKVFKGRVGYVSPHDLAAGDAPVPVRLVLFPSYAGGSRTELRPVSRAQAAFSLAANAFNRGSYGPDLLDLLAAVLAGARCFTLQTGDLDACGACLEALAADLPPA